MTPEQDLNRPPRPQLGRSPEAGDDLSSNAALDTDDPLLTELRAYTAIDDPEMDVRADSLVERLRQANPALSTRPCASRTAPDIVVPMPERLEYFRVEKV